MDKNDTPLRITCKNCGSPAGFDIVHQTYRCTSCGELTGITEVNKKAAEWKKLQTESTKNALNNKAEERSCPSCGATIIFKAGEASETCEYCGSKLVSRELASHERLPELIIPFYLTYAEARKRMLEWGHKHEKTEEGRSIVSSMGSFRGAYIPYVLVKGPVGAKIQRDGTDREYKCRGYIDGVAVSTFPDLDNLVLNAAEPFDWSEARPFELGYIAGQNVKLDSLGTKQVEARIGEEAAEDFLPQAEKAMQTSGIDLIPETGDMMSLSVLLPVYYIKSGKLTAVMNGQTGRIAVTKERKKKTYPWAIEPAIYTVLATLALSAPYKFSPECLLLFGMVFACLFFGIMSEGQNSLIRRITVKSENAKASRENDELKIDEKKDILKNPYENTPVFIEKNEKGEEVPVKIRFYTLGRILYMLFTAVTTVFLPAFIAAFFRWCSMKPGETFMQGYHPEYGAAWYVLTGFIMILYFAKGIRRDIYEHPLLYEIMQDGKLRRIKTEFYKPNILSMFGIGQKDEKGKTITLFRALVMLGGAGAFLGFTMFFILLGSTLAIVF